LKQAAINRRCAYHLSRLQVLSYITLANVDCGKNCRNASATTLGIKREWCVSKLTTEFYIHVSYIGKL
jgi:hypothetical protein